MSWEIGYEKEHPCKCGKGKVIETVISEDCNKTMSKFRLCCQECEKKYAIMLKNEYDEKGKRYDDYEFVIKG